MRVIDLLESQSPAVSAKSLHKEFSALAKEYGLILKGGMGWPRITQQGLWSGGGIAAGSQKVDDVVKDLRVDQRINTFLVDVADKLKQLIAQGRTVMIGRGSKADLKDAEPADADNLFSQLKHNLVKMRVPGGNSFDPEENCVVWFISHPADMVGIQTLKIYASNGYGDDSLQLHAAYPAKEASAIRKAVQALSDSYNVATTKMEVPVPDGKWKDAVVDLRRKLVTATYALADSSISLKDTTRDLYISVNPGVPGKGSKQINSEEFARLVNDMSTKLTALNKEYKVNAKKLLSDNRDALERKWIAARNKT